MSLGCHRYWQGWTQEKPNVLRWESVRGSSQPGINEQVMEHIREASWGQAGHSLPAREELCWNSSSVAAPNLHVAMGTSAGRDSLYTNDFNRNCSVHVPKLDLGKADKGNREEGTGICTEISFPCSALLCEGSRGCWNALREQQPGCGTSYYQHPWKSLSAIIEQNVKLLLDQREKRMGKTGGKMEAGLNETWESWTVKENF